MQGMSVVQSWRGLQKPKSHTAPVPQSRSRVQRGAGSGTHAPSMQVVPPQSRSLVQPPGTEHE